jgi:N-acetylglucosaminyldiphosphoundecaprenol N-acetyl-beta-D-mannosaminyltransferase
VNIPVETFPAISVIEGIPVTGFPNPVSLFERLVLESRQTRQSLVTYLNIHVANSAFINPDLKQILQDSTFTYCDGAGIVVGSRMLGNPLPTRLTAADWVMDMLRHFAEQNCKVYLLGGEPNVPEKALEMLNRDIPNHTVVGAHHGYILKDAALENRVIDEINRLEPDILIIGFGTPLQETWLAKNKDRLNVSVLYAIGAVMDFMTGKVSRCPAWMGKNGLEWLYRLWTEPQRLMGRYVIGNPWFLTRIATLVAITTFQQALSSAMAPFALKRS